MTDPHNMNDKFVELLAEEGNGAVEAYLPSGRPLLVVIIGPIKTWWTYGLKTPEYLAYAAWRDAVRVAVIHAGHLVYSPHRAWQGAWHEGAQRVNDQAIKEADVVIALTPPGVEAVGTDAEIAVAHEHGKHVILAPPAGEHEIFALINEMQVVKLSQADKD